MRRHAFVCALIAIALSSSASSLSRLHARTARSILPSASEAQNLLQTTTRHREWVNIATGSSPVLAFVVYPERDDKAPVVLVSVTHEQASVRARAIADQLAAEGFIGVVPDDLTGVGPNHAKRYAESLPAANGTSVWLNLDLREARADVVSDGERGAAVSFRATSADWPQVVGHLSRVTRNRPAFSDARTATATDEHAGHLEHSMAPAAQNQTSGATASRTIPGLADKPRSLPASYYTATATLARSRLKSEWVDIPVGNAKVRNWVS